MNKAIISNKKLRIFFMTFNINKFNLIYSQLSKGVRQIYWETIASRERCSLPPPLKKGGEGGLFDKRNAIYYKISPNPSFSKRGTLEVPIFMSQTHDDF